jgi:dUTP pyrophosphatase
MCHCTNLFNLEIEITDERLDPEDIGYKTEGAAAIDLYALPNENIHDNLIVQNRSARFSTGIKVAIPKGYVGIIVPRSSAGMDGYILQNTVGVIDSDYRGEIQMCLSKNNAEYEYLTNKKRIAQMMIVPCPQFKIDFVKSLSKTERGESGFGSTGKD